ncbi:hypothetical protein PMIN01_02943 [Paraphaeosphaeria minitans]|uniref:Uncharacterized protein n=1 Tax=Paraphaeosphaeria minitans TaxID=565426 RepID=A0A9P6GSA5_9PLEO|nr:hypothetical protein PMIN01_02943 [Paraphaeosphaeria minitans]
MECFDSLYVNGGVPACAGTSLLPELGVNVGARGCAVNGTQPDRARSAQWLLDNIQMLGMGTEGHGTKLQGEGVLKGKASTEHCSGVWGGIAVDGAEIGGDDAHQVIR